MPQELAAISQRHENNEDCATKARGTKAYWVSAN